MNGPSSAAAEEGVFSLAAVFASPAAIVGSAACNYGAPGWEPESCAAYDSFGARTYASNLGRFLSPDPLGGHLGNPQTLNKYAYAADNPVTFTDPTGMDFYLACTSDDEHGPNCHRQIVGFDASGNAQADWVQGRTGANGNFTAILVGNGPGGNLIDKNDDTGVYTASVAGGAVLFSNNGGASASAGVFANGTPQTTFQDAGWANGGALIGFLYTFKNSKLEANQTAAGKFTFAGSPAQADAALEMAGFTSHWGTENGAEYRSVGSFWTGADSGHFIVSPASSVPAAGDMHFGEHNPFGGFGVGPAGLGGLLHCLSDGAGPC